LNKIKGFTLVELLIVVAIIGVLAAIAIPVYSNYRNSAYRAAAKSALVEGAQNMERYFTKQHTYVGTTVGDVGGGDQVQQWTQGNRYQLTIPVATATAFTIRATPTFTENKFGYLEVTQTGAKTSEITGSW